MLFDDELDKIFASLLNDKNAKVYGYTMTVGPDGKPHIQEYGTYGSIIDGEIHEPLVDIVIDKKENTLKVIAELPGVEKENIDVEIVDCIEITIKAENGDKQYNVTKKLKHRVFDDDIKATYNNGVLELTFKMQNVKSKGKKIEIKD